MSLLEKLKDESLVINEKDLIDINVILDAIKKRFNSNSKYGHDLRLNEFLLQAKTLQPSAYGFRMQSYFSMLFDCQVISSKSDLGDFINQLEQVVEFKCSFLSDNMNKINIKQIRLWQDIDEYYVFVSDFENYEDIKTYLFKLSKSQMIEECDVMNAKSCHMTESNYSQNEKVELGFSISKDSENWKRWIERYHVRRLNLHDKVDKKLIKIRESSSQKEYMEELEARIKILENK